MFIKNGHIAFALSVVKSEKLNHAKLLWTQKESSRFIPTACSAPDKPLHHSKCDPQPSNKHKRDKVRLHRHAATKTSSIGGYYSVITQKLRKPLLKIQCYKSWGFPFNKYKFKWFSPRRAWPKWVYRWCTVVRMVIYVNSALYFKTHLVCF